MFDLLFTLLSKLVLLFILAYILLGILDYFFTCIYKKIVLIYAYLKVLPFNLKLIKGCLKELFSLDTLKSYDTTDIYNNKFRIDYRRFPAKITYYK